MRAVPGGDLRLQVGGQAVGLFLQAGAWAGSEGGGLQVRRKAVQGGVREGPVPARRTRWVLLTRRQHAPSRSPHAPLQLHVGMEGTGPHHKLGCSGVPPNVQDVPLCPFALHLGGSLEAWRGLSSFLSARGVLPSA